MNIKIKILITTLFILMFCNTSMAYTETYEWETFPSYTDDYGSDSISSEGQFNGFNKLYSNDIQSINGLYFLSCKIENIYSDGFDKSSQYWNVNFIIDGENKGNGIAGYSKGSTYTFINYWIQSDDGLISYGTGAKEITVSGIPDQTTLKATYAVKSAIYQNPDYAIIPQTDTGEYSWYFGGKMKIHYYTRNYFINTININDSGEIIQVEILRNSGNKSKYIINDPYELLNETSLVYNTIDLTSLNNSITIHGENFYEETLNYLYERKEAPGIPTLTTDKTYYNTSEEITISYTNIDEIYNQCTSSFCDEAYQIWIYAIDPIEDIPKYRNWLYSDRRDETFTLNTSFLLPQTTYKLVITSGETNIIIESDIFYVYPDDEYLSVSCGVENNCYTYNNAEITIYYKINNNSDIIIKDNDGNIINQYHNIIDEGEIIYHIPDDINHNNIYPNWKVYLNNTEYSTSFNKGITVYWSQFQTPTPTPIFTPQPTPDINISDEIDNLKDEISPIKDLIFGLSEIVIDNPDYNKDNIVDENEINHWFNSLIPICIIFLLIILYIGLKKQRE